MHGEMARGSADSIGFFLTLGGSMIISGPVQDAMARGSADSIGFFLTLSAEVTIINNGKLQEPYFQRK